MCHNAEASSARVGQGARTQESRKYGPPRKLLGAFGPPKTAWRLPERFRRRDSHVTASWGSRRRKSGKRLMAAGIEVRLYPARRVPWKWLAGWGPICHDI